MIIGTLCRQIGVVVQSSARVNGKTVEDRCSVFRHTSSVRTASVVPRAGKVTTPGHFAVSLFDCAARWPRTLLRRQYGGRMGQH